MCGTLDIITGCMRSGKSTELLRRLTIKSIIPSNKVIYVNHTLDDRNPNGKFSSHNKLLINESRNDINITFISAHKIGDILEIINDYNIIAFDEAQFFDDLNIVLELVEKNNKHIIISGLNIDYNRVPFSNIHDLEPFCDSYIKLKACCMSCAENGLESDALFTHRLRNQYNQDNTDRIIISYTEFISTCRKCYLLLNK
jgi:thymidine kinase